VNHKEIPVRLHSRTYAKLRPSLRSGRDKVYTSTAKGNGQRAVLLYTLIVPSPIEGEGTEIGARGLTGG